MSIYHPQTDGLVEQFNQTLKSMLKKVVADRGWDWDALLPYVLFAARETPQAFTGYTPFRRQPRRLLDVAKEALEGQPVPFRSVIEYVKDKLTTVLPTVREHLTRAQQRQQALYNRCARPREFQVGDQILLLVQDATCKFLANWQGPFTVAERLVAVNYRLQQPGKRRNTRVYHINLLKPSFCLRPLDPPPFSPET